MTTCMADRGMMSLPEVWALIYWTAVMTATQCKVAQITTSTSSTARMMLLLKALMKALTKYAVVSRLLLVNM